MSCYLMLSTFVAVLAGTVFWKTLKLVYIFSQHYVQELSILRFNCTYCPPLFPLDFDTFYFYLRTICGRFV